MYVNAFWFGVLMTLLAFMVVIIILAFIASKHADEDEEVSEEEFREVLEGMTGRKFRVIQKDGYMVGEPIEDPEDQDDQE